jgi:serine/threonine protein kinase/tetratricopeptide (TPR) repeat protein
VDCLSPDQVLDFAEGRLPGVARAAAEQHLDGCDLCRSLLVEAARGGAALPAREGRYRIERPIGGGAMGVVYAAWDRQLERRVALKLLRAESEDPESSTDQRALVLREARAMAQLAHPNVLTVYEAGVEGEQVYVAMELVEGGSLADWLEERPRGWREIVDAFLQAGRGLAATHAAGLVHRDFKPANVLAQKDGRFLVTDFGLAARAATQRGVAGSPGYMPPEQLRGEPADARSDVFSFSAALYQAITSELPFPGRTMEELEQSVADGPRWPDRARVPGRLRRILERGLAYDPARRYPSMESLLGDLEKAGRRSRLPVLAAAVVILAALGLVVRGAVSGPSIHSIAVLPLEDLSTDPTEPYFADGMTDEITTDLAKIGSLKVISRASAMQYRGSKKPAKQIASELNVDALVEGSVLRSGDRVRITATLIDARTDTHLWADSYEKARGELLGLQSSVASEIARRIHARSNPADRDRLRRREPVAPEAYEAYLQGRYRLTRQEGGALQKALADFQRAIDLDPSYAQAYAGLADTFALFANYGLMAPPDAFPRAEAAARRSIELDDSLAEPHASLGFTRHHFSWDWPSAEAEYQRAIALSPSYAVAHLRYAELLSTARRHDQALAEVRKAHELDPLSLAISTNVGRVLYYARRYDQAIDELRGTLELDPKAGAAHLYLGLAYEAKGMSREAIAELTEAQALLHWTRSLSIAHVLAGHGHRVEAEAIVKDSDDGEGNWVFIAEVYAALGNADAAFDYLEKAYRSRNFFLAFLDVDPNLDPIRSDPRFAALRKRIGLP